MLLAIDTATSHASIALHDGQSVRGECTWEAANRHTVTLVPHIAQTLQTSGVTVADLTAIAVCTGPGSYTGVRIGVAMAKGMAMAQQLPLVGITTLDIVAAGQPADARPMVTLFTAGRKRIGFARYRWQETGWQAETDVEIATWDELAEKITVPTLVTGEISPQGQKVLCKVEHVTLVPPAQRLRRAGFLADLAWTRIRAGQVDHAATLAPRYAR
jgi:tRNA threonylcarbamoyladenosine biosynthesis protein TsaB